MLPIKRIFSQNTRSILRAQSLVVKANRQLNSEAQEEEEDDNKLFFPSESHDAHMPATKEIAFTSHGTDFNMGYIDVGPRDGPLLVFCHGVPGDVLHFNPLFSPLTRAGLRVVVPEFPSYGRTTLKDKSKFDESTVARATLVLDFMQALGIHKADAVVGHSAGGFAALYLAAKSDKFRSLVHLSCLGLQPHRGVRPYGLTKGYAWLLRNSWTAPLAESLLLFAYRNLGGINIHSHEGLKEGIFTIAGFKYPLIKACAEEVNQKRLPALFASTQNDKVCEWPLNLELSQACGLQEEGIEYYDKDEKKVATQGEVKGTGFPRGIFFEKGGHFVFKSHTDIVVSSIIELITSLQDQR